MSRPNRVVIDENGKEVWDSRSVVVIPVVIKYDERTGEFFALLEKRGETVSHTGKWCCPCGFIDWDESLEEACQREVREETGLELDIKDINFFKVESDKHSKTQTVDIWYFCFVGNDKDFSMSKIETKDEVLELRWLKIADVEKGNPLLRTRDTLNIHKKTIDSGFGEWAFKTHHKKIVEMLLHFFEVWKCNIIND